MFLITRELWNWEKCKEKIRSLKGRFGFLDMPVLKFLGYTLKPRRRKNIR
ncbi:MAG: hypothetical protein ACTSYM_02495 [Candidatus Baldrarchaeia archaeon]